MNVRIADVVLFMVAGVLALVIARALLTWYLRTVKGYVESPPQQGEDRAVGQGFAPSTHECAARKPAHAVRARIQQRQRSMITNHLVAAATYAALAAIAVSWTFHVRSLLVSVLAFLVFLWPAVIACDIILAGQHRRRLAYLYVGALVILSAFIAVFAKPGGPPTVVPALLWVPFVWAGLITIPTIMLLPVLDRQTRSVGAAILLVFLVGIFAVRVLPDGGLPFFTNAAASVRASTGAGEIAALLLVGAVNMVLCLAAALGTAFATGRLHQAKYFSDQSMAIDAGFLGCVIPLVLHGYIEHGATAFASLATFAAFKGITVIARRRNPSNEGVHLLLLRAFEPHSPSRHTEFFRLLQAQWRYLGAVYIVGGPDLATETVDPPKLLRLLARRLKRSFVATEHGLERALLDLDVQPDPDGRYRINEIYCTGPVWQHAVQRFIARADVILLDLSSYRGQPGLSWEIQQVLASDDFDRTVFLVVESTRHALREELDRIVAASPERAGLAARVAACRPVSIEGSVLDAVRRVQDAIDRKTR